MAVKRLFIASLLLVAAAVTLLDAQSTFMHATRFILDDGASPSVGRCEISSGSGSPEGVVAGDVCDVYLNTTGGSGTVMYLKVSGVGSTGWETAGTGGGGGGATASTVSDSSVSIIRKTADESVTASTALQSDNELTLNVGANETWVLQYTLYVDGPAAADMKFALNVPSGTTGLMGGFRLDNSAVTDTDNIGTSATTDLTDTGFRLAGTSGAGSQVTVMVLASLTTSSTTGSVVLRWAQNNSDATATIVKANSVLIARHQLPAGVPDLLNSTKSAADTPDAEFDASIAPFTAVAGSSGTASLLAASGSGVYDVTSQTGWLLMQMGTGATVNLRQDYTLPDGESIVAPISLALDLAATPSNNEIITGIAVNDSDSDPFGGTAGQTAVLEIDTEASASAPARVIGWDGSTFIGPPGSWYSLRDLNFLRISRTGLNYDLFYSSNGFSWTYLGRKTMATAATNVWLFGSSQATMANRIVIGVPWFRQGSALTPAPWPLQ